MKIAIFVFLAIFAISAHAEVYQYADEVDPSVMLPVPRAKILDTIKKATNDFVRKSVNDFHHVEETFQRAANKLKEDAKELANKTKAKVQQAVSTVENKFKEIFHKGEVFFKCIKQNFPAFKELKNTAVTNLEECGNNVFHALLDFEVHAASRTTALVKTLAEVVELVGECATGNAIFAAKCAFKHIEDAKLLVSSTIDEFKALVATVREKAEPLIKDVKVCKNENFTAIASKIKVVEDSMNQCTKKN